MSEDERGKCGVAEIHECDPDREKAEGKKSRRAIWAEQPKNKQNQIANKKGRSTHGDKQLRPSPCSGENYL